jgi:hypothetical protein
VPDHGINLAVAREEPCGGHCLGCWCIGRIAGRRSRVIGNGQYSLPNAKYTSQVECDGVVTLRMSPVMHPCMMNGRMMNEGFKWWQKTSIIRGGGGVVGGEELACG